MSSYGRTATRSATARSATATAARGDNGTKLARVYPPGSPARIRLQGLAEGGDANAAHLLGIVQRHEAAQVVGSGKGAAKATAHPSGIVPHFDFQTAQKHRE